MLSGQEGPVRGNELSVTIDLRAQTLRVRTGQVAVKTSFNREVKNIGFAGYWVKNAGTLFSAFPPE